MPFHWDQPTSCVKVVLPQPGERVFIVPIQEYGIVERCRRDDRQDMIIEVKRESDGQIHLCRECEIKK